MYNRLQLATKYLHYYLTSSNGRGHGIHSPFIFDFITNVLNDTKQYYAYPTIESVREKLKKDNTVLDVEDFGAGSAMNPQRQRTVGSIARTAAKPKKLSQLLFRIVHYYQPKTIIELGTSLGISSAYMASAAPKSKVFTIEGAPAVAEVARRLHAWLPLHNVEIITGKFEDRLAGVLNEIDVVDLAFVDGNHRLEPTKFYFEKLLTKASSGSIFIFDDIHWSVEMEQAWTYIKNHPAVTASIDLFFIGVILFSPAFKSKQEFTIRF